MTNLFAICLVLTTLLAAEIWSPPPIPATTTAAVEDDVIVKEGHRVVVVESFDDHTKVSISSAKDGDGAEPESGFALPIFGRSDRASSDETHSPGELVCDSVGKCTHKMAKTIGAHSAAHRAAEVAEGAAGKASEFAHEAKEKVAGKAKEYAHQAKDRLSGTAEKASEVAHGAKDRIADTVRDSVSTAEDTFDKGTEYASHAKDRVGEAAKGVYSKAKETAARSTEKAKETAAESLDQAKETAARSSEQAKETAAESLGKAKNAAKSTKDVGKTIGKDVTQNVTMGAYDDIKPPKDNTKTIVGAIASWLKGLLSVVNMLGLATAYGMSVWVTFISSYILASVLPRQQLGMVQSKMYPVYFRAQSLSIGIALLSHLLRQWTHLLSAKSEMLQAFNLSVALLLIAVNGFYVEPLATKAMFERLRMEKEEGRGREQETQRHQLADAGPAAAGAELAEDDSTEEEAKTKMAELNGRVKKLNLYSSYLNIGSLMSLTWHLVHLGHNLHSGSQY
ncbi:Transmembrane protein 205 [Linum perenne]